MNAPIGLILRVNAVADEGFEGVTAVRGQAPPFSAHDTLISPVCGKNKIRKCVNCAKD